MKYLILYEFEVFLVVNDEDGLRGVFDGISLLLGFKCFSIWDIYCAYFDCLGCSVYSVVPCEISDSR